MNAGEPFWEKPLTALDRGEWEALCDGCGRCCVHKLEDEETGLLYATNVACKLLDRRNGTCLDYKSRMKRVSDCVKLDRKNLDLIAANEVGDAKVFEADDNALTLFWPNGGKLPLGAGAKTELGAKLMDFIVARFAERIAAKPKLAAVRG